MNLDFILRISKLYQLQLTETEARELYHLLEEMRSLNFTHSIQVSDYIVDHKLGYKYPNISGIVRMKDGNAEWDLEGGFPQEIYKIICRELNLSDKRSRARPIGYKPFQQILSQAKFWEALELAISELELETCDWCNRTDIAYRDEEYTLCQSCEEQMFGD
ncbi:MAG: hypothetical protein VKL42_08705 [Snowella sp.]|nr:hypothetical protein [Snowella sp.]